MDGETQAALPAVSKANIAAGGALAALVPQSLDDAFRLSKALAISGDMVPKHFQGKPEMIMGAIMRGMEVGLAPMQALSHIAVINGRACIWGDAIPALIQKAGHSLDSWIEGEGDEMFAQAELTRGDTGKVYTRVFTLADAKAAGLLGKPGPWQQYRKRMLEMRARAWAARDGAADALMGLQIAEEVQDAPPIRDVTPAEAPRGPNLAQRLQAPAAVEPHWTEGIAWDVGAPGSDAFDAGVAAFDAGEPTTSCPHGDDPAAAADWLAGWHGAARAKE